MTTDIHTHHYRPQDDCLQVLNIRLRPDSDIRDFPPPADNLLLSAGIHPWDTGLFTDKKAAEKILCKILSNERIAYIGEAGLDKLKGDTLQHQMELFRLQLSIADRLHKPVIIHCVKAMQEILAQKDDYKEIPEWIIHGFRGKATQARQWLEHGFSLSFGLHHDPKAYSLCPGDRRYTETDDL